MCLYRTHCLPLIWSPILRITLRPNVQTVWDFTAGARSVLSFALLSNNLWIFFSMQHFARIWLFCLNFSAQLPSLNCANLMKFKHSCISLYCFYHARRFSVKYLAYVTHISCLYVYMHIEIPFFIPTSRYWYKFQMSA